MRKTFTTLLALFLAVFCFGSTGEAAQKHNVRHRPRHSARVITTPSAAKKKATKKAKHQAHRTTSIAKKSKTTTKPK